MTIRKEIFFVFAFPNPIGLISEKVRPHTAKKRRSVVGLLVDILSSFL